MHTQEILIYALIIVGFAATMFVFLKVVSALGSRKKPLKRI